MKRCGLPKIHVAHEDCDGGSDYVDSFDVQDVEFEQGKYFEQCEDDIAPMSATEQYWHPENA